MTEEQLKQYEKAYDVETDSGDMPMTPDGFRVTAYACHNLVAEIRRLQAEVEFVLDKVQKDEWDLNESERQKVKAEFDAVYNASVGRTGETK